MSARKVTASRWVLALAIGAWMLTLKGTARAAVDTPHAPCDDPTVATAPETLLVPVDRALFGPDPDYQAKAYDPQAQIQIYGGKTAVQTPRPLLELGRALYGPGELGPGYAIFGDKNRFFPQVLLFGDWRTAVATNDLGGEEVSILATQLNLNLDIKLTGTERIHIFWKPLEDGADTTRWSINNG